jgi:acetamidase/formamidase
VRGALFEIGDGHAAQGDGEVDQTAIETSLRGRVQLTVRKGETLTWPRAETAGDYISMGTTPISRRRHLLRFKRWWIFWRRTRA